MAKTPYEQLLEDLLVERHRPVPDPPAPKPMTEQQIEQVVAEFWATDDQRRYERQLRQQNIRKRELRAEERERRALSAVRVLADDEIERLA